MSPNPPQIKQFSHHPSSTNVIAGLVLLGIVTGLTVWFLILPQQRTLSSQRSELTRLKSEREKLEQSDKDIRVLANELNSSQQRVQLLDEAVPLQTRITRMHAVIETIAQNSGMALAQISLDSTAPKTVEAGDLAVLADPYGVPRELQTQMVTVDMAGSLEQFVGFLQQLEGQGRVFDVQSAEITNSENNQLKFRVKVKSYAYGPEIPKLKE